VVGDQDQFTPVSDAEFIHECLSRPNLAISGGAGHMPNLERETAFNAALGQFLKSISALAHTER
jgi:pimeloyl-ACP methyl ester carboxylesterase